MGGLGRGWWIAAALAAAAILLTFDPKLYINGDNVDYIFLAREVRQGSLWPSDKFPPLFPWLLAPIQALFGLRLLPQKLLVTALALGSVYLLARLLRVRENERTGPWVLAIAATLVPVVEYSHYVMSEVPFLFFSLGALAACDRWEEPRHVTEAWRSPRFWGLVLWLAAGFYARTAGVAGMLAVAAWLLASGRRRLLAALLPGLALVLLPWVVHGATAGPSPYFRQLLSVNPYYPEQGRLGLGTLLARVGENLNAYLLQLVPVTVFPALYGSTYSPPALQKVFYPFWLAVPLLVPFGAGMIRGVMRRDLLAFWVLASLLLLLFWPSIWASSRFITPLAPLLLILWWQGWRWPQERGLGGPWPRVRAGVLVLLALLALRNLVFYSQETRRYPPEWEHYFATLDWIRAYTPRDAVVIDRKPGFVEFVAERKSRSFPREPDPVALRKSLQAAGATHLVVASLPYDDINRYLRPLVDRERAYFRMVQATGEPKSYLFEFHPEGGAGTVAPGVTP